MTTRIRHSWILRCKASWDYFKSNDKRNIVTIWHVDMKRIEALSMPYSKEWIHHLSSSRTLMIRSYLCFCCWFTFNIVYRNHILFASNFKKCSTSPTMFPQCWPSTIKKKIADKNIRYISKYEKQLYKNSDLIVAILKWVAWVVSGWLRIFTINSRE